MTMLVGYARVSTSGRSLDVQLDALRGAGCEETFAEKRSGSSTAGRVELDNALSFVRKGDTLVVTRLDRLARSAGDLHAIVKQLTEKGVAFLCLQQSSIDTTTSTGNCSSAFSPRSPSSKPIFAVSVSAKGSTEQKQQGSTRAASGRLTLLRCVRRAIRDLVGPRTGSTRLHQIASASSKSCSS